MKTFRCFAAVLALTLAASTVRAGEFFDLAVTMEPLGKMKAEWDQSLKDMSPEERAMMRQMGMDPAARFAPLEMQVSVEGDKARMDYVKSGLPMMGPGTYMLTDGASKTVTIVNTANKTCMELNAGQMEQQAKQAGMETKYSDVKVDFKDNLGAKTMLGYPVKLSRLDMQYTQTVKGRGMKGKPEKVRVTWDIWSTVKLPFSLFERSRAQFFQTGDAAVDAKIREAVGNALGMPLSWSALHYDGEGAESMRVTGEVKKFESKSFAASHFTVPAGYKKQGAFGMAMQQMMSGAQAQP